MPRLDINFRSISREEINKLDEQAAKLGIDRTGYVRLIINLDATTGIMRKLKQESE